MGKVGLIVDINSSERQCTLRHFLSIQQLQEKVGNHLPRNIICWPQQSVYPPVYLLDSDITSVVPFSEVVGLAFVFHEDDALVAQLRGMANTYVSSSFFSSQTFTITHGHKFHSFPSTASKILPSCFPSSLFRQLLRVKSKLHRAMNSRSMSAQNKVTFQVEGVDKFTWLYLKTKLPQPMLSLVVVKTVYVGIDDAIVEKWRGNLESCVLTLPEHLTIAQSLFGSAVGLGFRCMLQCRLQSRSRTARMTSSRQVEHSDELNVVPFEQYCREFVRRGIELKYLECEDLLTVTIRFRRIRGADNLLSHLEVRGMIAEVPVVEDEDKWPFCSRTLIHGQKVKVIRLLENVIVLESNEVITFNEAIRELNDML